MITVVRWSPCSVASRVAMRVRSGLVSIVAGESDSMNDGDGFGMIVASDCTWSTRGSCFIRSCRARMPSSTFGVQMPPSVGAWTTMKIGDSSPWPKSRRTRSTACRDSVAAGRTSTVTPRIFSHAAGSAIRPRTASATAMLATGRRMTAAIVVCQPVPLPERKPSFARRFQRSRCRCSRTSTTGRSRRPVTIAVAATIAIATATERITITGNRLSTVIVSASVIPEKVIERPAVWRVRSSACSSGAERSSSRKRLTMISEKSIASPRPIIEPMLSAKIDTSETSASR